LTTGGLIGVVYLRDACIGATAIAGGIQLALFGLKAEIENVLGGKHVSHPDILALFKGLVLVACGGHTMIPKLPK